LVYQLVYMSSTSKPLSLDELSEVLDQARERNFERNVTGLLIYHDQLFFQVLEGDKEDVTACYARISKDPRHRSLSVMWEGDAETRTFSSWDMAYMRPEDLDKKGKDSVIRLSSVAREKEGSLESGSVPAELVKWMLREFPVERIGSQGKTVEPRPPR
jgi:hypothetical protein